MKNVIFGQSVLCSINGTIGTATPAISVDENGSTNIMISLDDGQGTVDVVMPVAQFESGYRTAQQAFNKKVQAERAADQKVSS